MVFSDVPSAAAHDALRDVQYLPFWLDDPSAPAATPALAADISTDLLIVGAGFTGLWTALIAKERDPARDVVLVDADRVAGAASSRNGGFLHASLTHGLPNGVAKFADELPVLLDLGKRNFAAIREFVHEHGIDCDWRDSGEIEYAVQPREVNEVREHVAFARGYGEDYRWLDVDELRSRLDLPLVLGAMYEPSTVAMVNPARLAWGLRDICIQRGVRLYEHTMVTGLRDRDGRMLASTSGATSGATIDAARVVLSTNAARSLLPAVRRRIVPVYDYQLATAPLSTEQWSAVGWRGFEGIKGAGNRFHYARRTADGRILWGGYDAVYHWRNGVGPRFEHDDVMYAKLATHFHAMFPQLADVRFTHAWGGAIDTCSRFAPFWVGAHGGRVQAVAGFTGLGVGSSRFAAEVLLDRLDGRRTAASTLRMVQTLPTPFPPEPLRWLVIALTRWSLARADAHGGRRNLWLRLLDTLGLGFDS